MRLSDGIEWAVHCCTVLAVVPEGRTMPAAKLAEFHGVPSAYLGKHLQTLGRAGLVDSVPGRHGGFRLARSPADISLLDVVVAVEGGDTAFRCTEIRQRGPAAVDDPAAYPEPCGIAAAMWRAEEAWRRELAAVSIADIGRHVLNTVPPDQLVAGATWISAAIERRSRP